VSLVVERGVPPPPPKEKLVSMNGKFVTVSDPPPAGPNGTAFTVTVAAGAAEILDRTNVVVVGLALTLFCTVKTHSVDDSQYGRTRIQSM
jgi:hypothetical protein